MVMENHVPPSPESVGREFVRQYYTLLNSSPLHLHRFYSHDSSFIHGGLMAKEQPVTGQKEIHQKIMQLNFRDCHAKIRQVDAHATLSQGVVVQVSGELSNNRQPLRRFMQTFVLAPQSPKKYYVHNDIFRYQDEVFNEEEAEGADSGTTSILDESSESLPTVPIINNNNNNIKGEPITVSVNEPRVVNGNKEEQPRTPSPVIKQEPVEEEEIERIKEEPQSPVAQPPPDAVSPAAPVEEKPAPTEPASNGPLTYAKLVKSGPATAPPSGGQSAAFAPPSSGGGFSAKPPSKAPEPVAKEPSGKRGGGGGRGGVSGRGGMTRERYVSTNREGEEDHRARGSTSDRSNIMSSGQYSDSQQLFVGNLPHNCVESDLENLFNNYGKVAEVRISSKGANSQQGKHVPNFGFVVFEDERSVAECLKKRPILLPNNHRLNIGEKKNNKSGSSGGNRQMGGSYNDRGSQDNLGRGGMSERGGRGARGGQRGGSRGYSGSGGRGGQQSQIGGQSRGGASGGFNRRS